MRLKRNLLSLVFFVFCVGFGSFGQNIEFNRFYKEAEKQQFCHPDKSLTLYNYLLENNQDSQIKIQVYARLIETERFLGNYVEAVNLWKEIRETKQSADNAEFYIQEALLLADLGFAEKSRKNLEKIELNVSDTSSLKPQNIETDLTLAAAYLDTNLAQQTTAFKNILKSVDTTSHRLEALTYHLAENLIHTDKDSAVYYFNAIAHKAGNCYLKPYAKLQAGILEKNVNVALLEKTNSLTNPFLLQRILQNYKPTVNDKNKQLFFNLSIQKDSLDKEIAQIKRDAQVNLIESVYYTSSKIKSDKKSPIVFWIWGVMLILLMLFLGLKFYARYKKTSNVLEENPTKSPMILDRTEEEILLKLAEFEKSTLFLNKKFRIADMAKKLNTNTRYLSIILNEKKHQSFNTYINHLRINYILHKLHNEPVYLTYKISYLVEESGFSSHNSFTSAFREVTGQTPSKYIKNLQKE